MKGNNKDKSFSRGKERALYILQKSDKTEYEIRNKLKLNEYQDSVIDQIICFLKEYDYINDYRYAIKYTSYKSNSRSYRQIKMELCKKGIPGDVLKDVFESIERDEHNTIKKFIDKKNIDWTCIEDTDIHKLVNYLFRKGFQYEQIIAVIKELNL